MVPAYLSLEPQSTRGRPRQIVPVSQPGHIAASLARPTVWTYGHSTLDAGSKVPDLEQSYGKAKQRVVDGLYCSKLEAYLLVSRAAVVL